MVKNSFYKGDSVSWTHVINAYSSQDWQLVYDFANNSFTQSIQALSNADGSYSVNLSSDQTAVWKAGSYLWQAKVIKGEEIYTIQEGNLTVYPSLSRDSVSDRQSIASTPYKIVKAIDDYFLDTNNLDAASVTIQNKQISRYSLDELIRLRTYFASLAEREERRKNNLPEMATRKIVTVSRY